MNCTAQSPQSVLQKSPQSVDSQQTYTRTVVWADPEVVRAASTSRYVPARHRRGAFLQLRNCMQPLVTAVDCRMLVCVAFAH